jgi:hypothetical protein
MTDLRLRALAIQIETLKKRLGEIQESNERLILLREMRLALQQTDEVVEHYIDELVKETKKHS